VDFPDKMVTGISCPNGKSCWLLDFAKADSLAEVQDDILLCKDCLNFKEVIERGFGRRSADAALGKTIIRLLQAVFDKTVHLERTGEELKSRARELALIKTISDAAVKTTELDKALRIILTGVTSGSAFGFNRAAIFLVDGRQEYLEGKHAVGPWSPEEASDIWNKLKDLNFDDQIRNIIDTPLGGGDDLHRSITGIKIPLAARNNIFIENLYGRAPVIVTKENIDSDLAERISSFVNFNEFVIIPLRSDGRPVGIMIADNYFTRRPIGETDINVLQTLAVTCTNILEKTILHAQLAERLKELEHLNKVLRENQNYLIRTERLTDLGRMASIIAHEFKTPLAAIGGYARKAIRTQEKGKFNPNDLEIIKSEVSRLEAITSELLDFSRLKLELKPHDINALTEKSLELLGNQIASCGIKLKKSLKENLPLAAIDDHRFRQVFFNMVNNAIEAMKHGGRLAISTRADDQYVILEIRDNGCGIPAENKEQLFDLFFTTKARGSGLGLSISKRIVEDHGGYIDVDSALGAGARFLIYFPVLPEENNGREISAS